MTTPTPRLLGAPRQLAAFALVGYAGLYLFLTFLNWVVPEAFGTFASRSAAASRDFTSLVVIALPVLAVLLAAAIDPPVPAARLIATIAVIEYVVLLFFGALTFLIGLGGLGGADGVDVISYLLLGLGQLGLAAVAGLVAYQAWTRLGGSLAALARPSAPVPPAGPTPPAA